MLKSKIKRTLAVVLTLVTMLSILFVVPVGSEATAYVTTAKSRTYNYWDGVGNHYNVTYYMPKININSSDANSINNSIRSLCNPHFTSADQSMSGRYSLSLTKMNYSYAISQNILSVVITFQYGGAHPEYAVFSINVSTGKKVSNAQLASAFATTFDKVKQDVANAIKKEFNSINNWRSFNGATAAYNRSLSNSNLNYTQIFVGSSGLRACYHIYWLAGAECQMRLIDITKNAPTPSVNATNNGAEVKWNKISGVPKYRVYKKINGSWKKLGDTTSNKYTDKSAKAGGTYTYTVRGINSNASTFMTSYKASGASVKFLATPKVNRRDYTSNGAKVSWSKVTGASKYRLYQWNNNKWNKIGDTSNNFLNLTNFASGANYRYTVRAISSNANQFTSGYNTNGYSFKYISIPQIYDIYNTSSNGIMVKWSKPTGAEKFRVYRKSGNGSWQKIADTNSTQYHDRSVKSGVYYKYTVRCMTKDAKQFVSYYNTYGYGIRH